MKFELEDYHRNIPDDELIGDLKKAATMLRKPTVTIDEYNDNGRFHSTTLTRRFGSWFKVLEMAGLEKTRNLGVSDEEYYENLAEVWAKLGRQPKYDDMQKPLSKYVAGAYEKRFGTWRKALEKFIPYINTETVNYQEENTIGHSNGRSLLLEKTTHKHKTKRAINNRLRVQVLIRDGNTCRICGIKVTGDDIHIDHITPWSKGGETILENLQVLCSKCNIGKGDL